MARRFLFVATVILFIIMVGLVLNIFWRPEPVMAYAWIGFGKLSWDRKDVRQAAICGNLANG